jgi:hypothetical protein
VAKLASFEPRLGEGPVGTGVHVLRRAAGPAGSTVGEVWVTLLFVPLVPLGEWTMEGAQGQPPAWQATRVARPRLARSAGRLAVGVLAVGAALLPAYLAIAVFMGSKAVELGGLFASAGVVVGALGWLDQTRERVPLRDAVRLLLGRKTGGS